jgi:hypothetical protein
VGPREDHYAENVQRQSAPSTCETHFHLPSHLPRGVVPTGALPRDAHRDPHLLLRRNVNDAPFRAFQVDPSPFQTQLRGRGGQ